MELTQETISVLLVVIAIILVLMTSMILITHGMIRNVTKAVVNILAIVSKQHLPSAEEIATKKADEKQTENLNKEAQDIGKGFK